MYSLDAQDGMISTSARPTVLYVQNFQEFVRIAIDGPRPLGNGVQGSRASDYYGWYNVGNFVAVNGQWAEVDDASYTNVISEGQRGIPNTR